MTREWLRGVGILAICELGIHLNEIAEHLPRYAFHLLFWVGGGALWVIWVKACGIVEGCEGVSEGEAKGEGEGEA